MRATALVTGVAGGIGSATVARRGPTRPDRCPRPGDQADDAAARTSRTPVGVITARRACCGCAHRLIRLSPRDVYASPEPHLAAPSTTDRRGEHPRRPRRRSAGHGSGPSAPVRASRADRGNALFRPPAWSVVESPSVSRLDPSGAAWCCVG